MSPYRAVIAIKVLPRMSYISVVGRVGVVGADPGGHNETRVTARPAGGEEGDHRHHCQGTC